MKNYESKNHTTNFGKLIIAVYALYVYVYSLCTSWSVRLDDNSLFVGLGGWGVRGNERKICK